MKKILLLLFSITCLTAFSQQFCNGISRRNVFTSAPVNNNLSAKWKKKTNGKILASPVLYHQTLLTGSCDSNLYALHAINGKVLWKFKTGGEIRSSVAVDAGVCYFIATDGILYAVNVETGKLKWIFKTGGEQMYDAWDYYNSSPAIKDGVIYFGSGDHNVYAVKVDGSLLWKYKTNGIVHAAPALADDAVLIGSFDGFFYCINEDGTLRWKFNTIGEHYFPLGEVQFHAVVADSSVYFCSRDYNVYALNIHNGNGFWVYHLPGSWTSVPSLADNKLIVTTSDAHNILAFNSLYGGKIYEAPVPLNVFSSATITDSSAYFGCMDGAIYKLNINSGKISRVFQNDLSLKNRSSFLDSSDRLKKEILEKYKNDATPLYTEFLKMGSILSTIWIDNGTLYFGSADGYIYAVE